MGGAPKETHSPRIGLVFWLGQCDKENHGWREGPPLTDSLQGCDLWRAFTLPSRITLERKKNTAFCGCSPAPSLSGMAGILPYFVHSTPWFCSSFLKPRA